MLKAVRGFLFWTVIGVPSLVLITILGVIGFVWLLASQGFEITFMFTV